LHIYEIIPLGNKSARIKHIKDRKGKVLYSNLEFLRLCKMALTPFELKKFSTNLQPQHFNFLGYKMAWCRAFYYRSFDHSWIISFDERVLDQYIQSWLCNALKMLMTWFTKKPLQKT